MPRSRFSYSTSSSSVEIRSKFQHNSTGPSRLSKGALKPKDKRQPPGMGIAVVVKVDYHNTLDRSDSSGVGEGKACRKYRISLMT
jgi:hypothetical protein